MAELSPMMKQYMEIKEQNKDTILFFRLGDFYEMFFDDAILASKELELTLTGRDCGQEERAPMCGVPYHAVDQYIDRLIEKGYKVAICEQMEDPATAKGIVKRGIIRVVTAGTVTNSKTIDEKSNNFLCCVYKHAAYAGLSFVDVTTGDLFVTECDYDKAAVLSDLAAYNAREIVCNREFSEDTKFFDEIKARFGYSPEILPDECFDADIAKDLIIAQFKKTADDFKISKYTCALISVGVLLQYLSSTQMCALPHINNIEFYTNGKYMDIDFATRRNLELVSTMRENKRKGSLLWVLDNTKTSMGARMIKSWIEKPLISCGKINKRLDAVEEIYKNSYLRNELRAKLDGVYDIERLLGKIVTGSANCRDIQSLGNSLIPMPEIFKLINEHTTTNLFDEIKDEADCLEDICDMISRAIVDEPPVTVKEGGIIRDGFNEDVDKYRIAIRDGKSWLASIEEKEREATGIKNLKIGYNKVFGYYIEVSKSNISLVPETYIRKQTLANGERYITGELKEIEDKILSAQERIFQLEYKVFCEVRELVLKANDRIRKTARLVAVIDSVCSFAEVSVKNNYCKPTINDGDHINIKDGRHPVVEMVTKTDLFVPNDTVLSQKERVAIITGPNMSGKSTYMRQVALITLMAQIGCFVPASKADIGIVDKIFTRVGASDDLASGQSTFMVEMNEVANILDNATKDSLIILDEIGRGTSTYDGLAIAWAVVEYINNTKKLGAKTLFATHYHELTELEHRLEGVNNYCIAVKKRGDDITFLRKIIKGGADDSYGVEVANLAGVKKEVIKRAKEIVKSLEGQNVHAADTVKIKAPKKEEETEIQSQLSFGSDKQNELIEKLKNTELDTLTPIEAMNILYKLRAEAQKLTY